MLATFTLSTVAYALAAEIAILHALALILNRR
jgi:hypothetical protein